MKPWTVVNSFPAEEPAILKSTDGKSISHSELINSIPEAREGFWYWSYPLAYNGHAQTFLTSRPEEDVNQIYYGRRLMAWKDGAQTSLDYVLSGPAPAKPQWLEDVKYAPSEGLPRYPVRTRYLRPEEIKKLDNPTDRPLVIHVHGLTGGSHESYLRAVVAQTEKIDHFDTVVITSRGCNRTKITTPQLFCGLWTDDLRNFVKHVKSVQPDRRIYLVGYSLGASIVANYLAQEGSDSLVSGGVAVSAPWDYVHSSHMMDQSFMGRNVYRTAMAQNLLRLVKNNYEELSHSPAFMKQWEKSGKGRKVKTIRDFDTYFTSALFGFDSAFDYYRNASPILRLRNVRTPLLIVSAQDDPICGDISNPYHDAPKNPYVHMLTTTTGGHLGWYGVGGYRWHADVIAKYLVALDKANVKRIESAADKHIRYFENDRLNMLRGTN